MTDHHFLWSLAFATSYFHLTLAQTLFDQPSLYFGGGDADVYIDWHESAVFNRSAWFPAPGNQSSKGVAIHWNLDEEWFTLAVAARAEGWVGFGIAEAGGMEGSDIVYFEAANPLKLVDAHVLDDKYPMQDICNDWELLNSTVADNFIIFEARRRKNSTDLQDRPLKPDSDPNGIATYVIAAWGDTPTLTYHEPENRVRGQLRFHQSSIDQISPSFAATMEGLSYFEHTAIDHPISTNETEYVDFCLTRFALLAKGVPVDDPNLILVGFEPIVDPRAVDYVHHFTVRGSSVDGCGNATELNSIYAWAPGNTPLALPSNVGMPFGTAVNVTGLKMNVHYNNPGGVPGILDSSGVRYYYTTEPREHDLGSGGYGDPMVALRNTTVGEGYTAHTFDCPSTCTDLFLDEPITVIQQTVHMHQKGISSRLDVIRNNEIVHTSLVDFFQFEQQGNHAIHQEPYQIYPGDVLRVRCEYNADADTVFGLASNEEMCMVNILYYPRKTLRGFGFFCAPGIPFPMCTATHDATNLSSSEDLTRQFGRVDVEQICAVTEDDADEEETDETNNDVTDETGEDETGETNDEETDEGENDEIDFPTSGQTFWLMANDVWISVTLAAAVSVAL